MSNRPSFRPIAAPIDVDDDALDRINSQLGDPTLRKPGPESPSARHAKPQDGPNDEPRSRAARQAQASSGETKKAPIATPGPVERFCFQLPGYLSDAMKIEAARQHTSLRHIVLRGLAAIGFEIAPEDLAADARRIPTKPSRR
jgi:hypothetical protein